MFQITIYEEKKVDQRTESNSKLLRLSESRRLADNFPRAITHAIIDTRRALRQRSSVSIEQTQIYAEGTRRRGKNADILRDLMEILRRQS